MEKKPLLSIVSPVYNEEECIEEFLNRVENTTKKLECDYEIIIINDSSTDSTENIVTEICEKNSKIKLINLSRNYGHQPALLCGLMNAKGDFVISLDSDLQDPPELILKIYENLKNKKFEIVNTKRVSRSGENIVKKFLINVFYFLSSFFLAKEIKYQVGDYRGVNRRVLNLILNQKNNFFYRSIVSQIGFNQICIDYDREKRFKGESKINLIGLIKFALSGIFTSGFAPMTLILFLFIFQSLIFVIYIVFGSLNNFNLILVSLIFTLILYFLILFQYLKNIINIVNNKPIYIIKSKINFD